MLNFTVPHLLHWPREGSICAAGGVGLARSHWRMVATQKESARALYELELELKLELELTPFRGHSNPCLPGSFHVEKYDHRIRRVQVTSALSGCARTYRAMSPSREELIGTSSDRYLQLAGPTGHRCEVTARAAGGNLTVDIEGRRPWKVLKESWSAG
jgi:hypothetical protein